MALSETARLVASLELDDNTKKGVNSALKNIGKIEKRTRAVGGAINRNLGRAIDVGLAAGVHAVTDFIGQGLDSLSQLEDATGAVDAAIKQMGLTGKVTAGQIAGWANEIEASVDAAFDDKDITRAASTLIRFGKISAKNIRPALAVMTDLAVKTGSVDSAATLLGRALADPTKAAGKLARAGVILTKAQQKQIAALVKTGKVAEAQKVIIDALAKSTAGAAKASKGEFADSQAVLADTIEDTSRAFSVGFLPVITKVRDILNKELAKPSTIAAIKGFGTNIASGLDQLITAAQKVPWDRVATAMKTAAEFGGRLINAFANLPPEAQATIIALAGLNKLTGGAVTGVVSELSKGLIKGVLGMTAGVVNLKAGVVNGGGGAAGTAAGAAGAAGGATSRLGKIASGLSKLLVVGFVAEMAAEFGPEIQGLGKDLGNGWRDFLKDQTGLEVPKIDLSDVSWPFGPKDTPKVLPEIFGGNGLLGGRGADTPAKPIPANLNDDSDRVAKGIAAVTAATNQLNRDEETRHNAGLTALSGIRAQTAATKDLLSGGNLQVTDTRSEAAIAGLSTTTATLAANIAAGDTRSEVALAGIASSQAAQTAAITAGDTRSEAALARLASTTATGDAKTVAAVTAARSTIQAGDSRSEAALTRIQAAQVTTKSTIAAGDSRSEAALSRIQGATNAVKTTVSSGLSGVKGAANATAQAVRNKDLSVDVTVPVTSTTIVSVRGVTKSQTKYSKYGVSVR